MLIEFGPPAARSCWVENVLGYALDAHLFSPGPISAKCARPSMINAGIFEETFCRASARRKRATARSSSPVCRRRSRSLPGAATALAVELVAENPCPEPIIVDTRKEEVAIKASPSVHPGGEGL